MEWFEALLLGLIQGLTEFLPVSSSGHLEIAKHLLRLQLTDDLTFTILVHAATVLATVVVFWSELRKLTVGLLQFRLNVETYYVGMLVVSMIPVGIVGVLFKDEVEALFGNGLTVVACALLVTAVLLLFAYFYKPKERKLTFTSAFIIGLAQAVAVIPGLSRSGTTIATGLLLGNKKSEVAQFSFLMVIVPILGECLLDVMHGSLTATNIPVLSLIVGFVTAFLSGIVACKFMVALVKKGKLLYFAIYCVVAACVAFCL
ncbi:undecaprenyl-diphosphatase [Bacteroidia bacterium]|nr:undecaprenyl-diphosphatase [Bacteroidia bacterium]